MSSPGGCGKRVRDASIEEIVRHGIVPSGPAYAGVGLARITTGLSGMRSRSVNPVDRIRGPWSGCDGDTVFQLNLSVLFL